MTRRETTQLLTDVLVASRLSNGNHYAKEVTLDCGTSDAKRVDVMEFCPKGGTHVSDIEQGVFICYEIKSCIEDVYSGNGINFFGERNYLVTTMETYKRLSQDMLEGKLDRFITEHHPRSSHHYGIMVPVPAHLLISEKECKYEEYENPTPFEGPIINWKMCTMIPCYEGKRNKSTTELLFCMLRSK